MADKIKLPENIHQFPTRQDYVNDYYKAVYEYMDSLPPRDVAKSISIMCIQSARLTMPKGQALDDAIGFWKSPEMLSFITDLVRRNKTQGAIEYLAELPRHIEEMLEEENEYTMEPLAPKVDASGHVIHDAEGDAGALGTKKDGENDEEEDGTVITPALSGADYNSIMGIDD